MRTIAGNPGCGAPAASGSVMAGTDGQRVRSSTLLKTARKIVIEHEGEEYVLRITSQNKLILTK